MRKSSLLLGLSFGLGALQAQTLTTNTGAPVGDNQNSLTIGNEGPVLLQDIHLLEKLASFDRERIPERVVHARGVGAGGVFVSAGDFSKWTKADFLAKKGLETPVFVRFSTVIHGSGSPETLRDPRGFATKFYTRQGNYDLVGNNLPVFFIRDAIKFPDMVHSLKPSPYTNRQDPNRFFDFFSNLPESTHMLTRLYSNYGIPASYREMNGSSVHSFKWVNEKGEIVYVKYTWKTKQGERNLNMEEAAKMQSQDFQHATHDLYQAIARKDFPKWDLYVQMIKPEEFEKLDFSPLDPTKNWDEKLIPATLVGTMTLNQMPDNYFEGTEQAAFAPGSLVPGIEPSEDKLLQGRLFSYFDTQRYRLGVNFQQLPVNAPKTKVYSHNQNGTGSQHGHSGDVNYQPSHHLPYTEDAKARESQIAYGQVMASRAKINKTNDFAQAGDFYRSLPVEEQAHLHKNLLADLSQVTDRKVQSIMVGHFYKADANLGMQLAQALKLSREDVEKAMKN